MARKRKIHAKPPLVGKKLSFTASRLTSRGGKRDYDLKKVSASERVREFLSEPLTVSAGKPFFNAFRESLVLKKSVLVNHVKSTNHESNLYKTIRDEGIWLMPLRNMIFRQTHRKGETLNGESKVYRIKVLMALIKAGSRKARVSSPERSFARKWL